ncbi:anti-sigma factor domain-containing protein [Salipaludibacillus sp. CUR1]|uniref:anti-sigma-I factor RsgI family protein n=1 Tax=Salipaludibacillus sp. CUR1 TaxID=2820003 RepID=UPI001E5C7A5D|nr:anti-sigma factor domain-containing protein [Salipaludibacillus sp. CUR1]
MVVVNKGVVMEVKKRHVIVLTKDGELIRAKPEKQAQIGEEIEFSPVVLYTFFHNVDKKLYSVPAAFVLIFILVFPFSSLLQSSEVHGVVSLDINPSIEMAVDENYDILYTEGYNKKGKLLLSKVDEPMDGMSIVNATSLLIKKGLENGLVEPANALYFSSPFSLEKKGNWKKELEAWSSEITEEYGFDIYFVNVERELVNEAREASMSPVKLLLLSYNKEIDLDSSSVSDIPIQDLQEILGYSPDETDSLQQMTNESDSGNNHGPAEAEEDGVSEGAEVEDSEDTSSLNPAGQQSHPHRDEHPGKGEGKNNHPRSESPSSENKNESPGNKEGKTENTQENRSQSSNKNQVSEEDKSNYSNKEGKGSGKPDHSGSGKPDHAGSGKPDHAGNGKPDHAGSGKPDHAGGGKPGSANEGETGNNKGNGN